VTKPPPDHCKQCGKRKKLPGVFYTERAYYEADPFCSRKCSEAYHGITEREGRKL
jgi:hypothetical protein